MKNTQYEILQVSNKTQVFPKNTNHGHHGIKKELGLWETTNRNNQTISNRLDEVPRFFPTINYKLFKHT